MHVDYLVERVGSYDRQNMALSIGPNRLARWEISLPVPERGEALDKTQNDGSGLAKSIFARAVRA